MSPYRSSESRDRRRVDRVSFFAYSRFTRTYRSSVLIFESPRLWFHYRVQQSVPALSPSS